LPDSGWADTDSFEIADLLEGPLDTPGCKRLPMDGSGGHFAEHQRENWESLETTGR